MTKLVLAGEETPEAVAEAFSNAEPSHLGAARTAYHQGILSATHIGALRKRGFLTGPEGQEMIGGQRRTVSLITGKGIQAIVEYRGIKAQQRRIENAALRGDHQRRGKEALN